MFMMNFLQKKGISLPKFEKLMDQVFFMNNFLDFLIIFSIAILPLIITIYYFVFLKTKTLVSTLNCYNTLALFYLSIGPLMIFLYIDEFKFYLSNIKLELVGYLLVMFFGIIFILLVNFLKRKISPIDSSPINNRKNIIPKEGLFLTSVIILFLIYFSFSTNPAKISAIENSNIEEILIQNETLINNTLSRYKILKGEYPKTLSLLVNKKDSTFLKSIPYNPETNDFSWETITKNGRITHVTAKYDNNFQGESIFKSTIFIKENLYIICIINLISLFLFIWYFKKKQKNFSLLFSIIFFISFSLIFSIFGSIYTVALKSDLFWRII
jgi:hypothetical protein